MDVGILKNLELLPEILKIQKANAERLEKLLPPITTKKEVARFLNKAESTINKYMSDGLLVEGYHFYRKNGKILVFIEDAILEFRDKLHRGVAHEKVAI